MALEAPIRRRVRRDHMGCPWAYKKGGLVRPISGVPVSWVSY